jgi:HlyD family secretion protein
LRKFIVIIVFVLLLPVVGAYVYMGHRKGVSENLCYSGTVEAGTRSNLAFEVSGRISEIFVDEGNRVEKEKIIARIDPSVYQARHEEALSMLDQSAKNLERLEILLTVYEKTLPADVKRARAGVDSATAILKEAETNKGRFDNLKKDKVVSSQNWENVSVNYETAGARLSEAKAVLEQSESNLKKIDLTRSEIKVAEAQHRGARAAVALARIQLNHTQLTAPFDGIVVTRGMEPGEVVSPGKEVLTLSDLSRVELKIFVDEEQIGKVTHGEEADVKIDTYPDRVYAGKVSFISPEAEFTPKIIETHKERVKLVYLVKISIPNPDLSLKPGMPADACFKND